MLPAVSADGAALPSVMFIASAVVLASFSKLYLVSLCFEMSL